MGPPTKIDSTTSPAVASLFPQNMSLNGHSTPRFAFQFDHENPEPSAKVVLEHCRPELREKLKQEKLFVKEFTGGVTNKLLAAYFASDKADKTLMRVYGAETDKIIDREGEISTLETLNHHKCSGKLFGVFDNGICYEFVHGETLTLDTVKDPHISRLVIEELVKLHCIHREEGEEAFESADIFEKLDNFLAEMPKSFDDPEKQRRFEEYYPNAEMIFSKEIKLLRQHLADPAIPSPKVFCHNDLLCANILYDKTKDRVNFIDFEYAGLNFQAYDLANHFNEFAGVEDCDQSRFPSREFQMAWLTYYLECFKQAEKPGGDCRVTSHQVESLYVNVNKFTLVSHLLWIIWTLIQAAHSEIEFDFLGYGKLRFDEYNRRKEQLLTMQPPSV